MFPLAFMFGKTSGGLTFIGLIACTMMLAGFIGTVTSVTKLLSTDSADESEKANRKIAVKGLWFSSIPVAVWLFFMLIGSMAR